MSQNNTRIVPIILFGLALYFIAIGNYLFATSMSLMTVGLNASNKTCDQRKRKHHT